MDQRICYLCGEIIGTKEVSVDHVPPKQFFPKLIRRQHNLDRLKTLPSHKTCNTDYQPDEDYFINSIGTMAVEGSPVGRALWEDIKITLKRPQGQILGGEILKEFSEYSDAGIVLPHGKMFKKFDPKRVWRVFWKITRGLFFIEHGRFLPENTHKSFELYSVGEIPPDRFKIVRDTPPRGEYGKVFEYKYREMKNDGVWIHYWALLFWDQLIMTVIFHDPGCLCDHCAKREDV